MPIVHEVKQPTVHRCEPPILDRDEVDQEWCHLFVPSSQSRYGAGTVWACSECTQLWVVSAGSLGFLSWEKPSKRHERRIRNEWVAAQMARGDDDNCTADVVPRDAAVQS